MGIDGSESNEKCTSGLDETRKIVLFMGTEMRFRCQEFAEAFQEKMSGEAKKRVWAYYKCKGRAIDAIRLLGLNSSVKTFSSRLREIANQIGANSARELFHAPKPITRRVTSEFLSQLIKRQEYRCALSGIVITPDTAALDHIVPYSEGGKNTRDNVQWVHEDVNRMKGQMGNREFKEWCRRVAGWTG